MYGPANMSNMPMKMANQSNYLSKTGAQGYGATSLVSTRYCTAVPCSLPFLVYTHLLLCVVLALPFTITSAATAYATTESVSVFIQTIPPAADHVGCCAQSLLSTLLKLC